MRERVCVCVFVHAWDDEPIHRVHVHQFLDTHLRCVRPAFVLSAAAIARAPARPIPPPPNKCPKLTGQRGEVEREVEREREEGARMGTHTDTHRYTQTHTDTRTQTRKRLKVSWRSLRVGSEGAQDGKLSTPQFFQGHVMFEAIGNPPCAIGADVVVEQAGETRGKRDQSGQDVQVIRACAKKIILAKLFS